MDKFIGKTLNDRYILTEIVGVGGMAVVYKAFDKVVNRVVAVKILKEEFMSDAQFRRRFANESKAITMLSQNNIVDVYDVCLEGDLMYLVMEYIDGITLKEYIDKVKVLDWHEAAFYIKQILKAMSHAHERGIVHRDLKPHNIMLLRDGTIKVTDFGIAKLSKFDTQTITDKAIGSVHYISPEQASGDRTDEKTDIYSVGVMLYEMLTGTLPFIADTAVSVALMQVQAQPTLPRDINDTIPEGIEEITIKAMMKDPSMRYSSALLMFNDIIALEENPDITFGYLYEAPEQELNVTADDSPTQFVDLDGLSKIESTYDNAEPIDDELEQEQEEESKFKSTWFPILSGVASAILVVGLVIFGIIFFPEISEKVSTPEPVMVVVENYVGKNFDEISQNNETGLIFERNNITSEEEEGTILSQDPAANTEVEKGSVIQFDVSIGVETVQVPDISEKHFEVAIDELNELDIKHKTKYVTDDNVKENYVIKTDPAAYTEIDSDTTVTVYISTGPEIITTDVPELVNRKETDAVNRLASVGLDADKVYIYSDKISKDLVISQSPEAGTKVEEGTKVKIEISLGPKPQEEKPEEPKVEDEQKPETPPVVEEKVNFTETIDLKSYKESGKEMVNIYISAANNSFAKSIQVTLAEIEAQQYIYTIEPIEIIKGTVVTIYVEDEVYKTVTVS